MHSMSVLLSMQENETPESAFHKVQDMFCDVTDDAVKESVSDALHDEVGNTVFKCDNADDNKGITIVSDARHGWRKNSRFSDIISLGYRTNKLSDTLLSVMETILVISVTSYMV